MTTNTTTAEALAHGLYKQFMQVQDAATDSFEQGRAAGLRDAFNMLTTSMGLDWEAIATAAFWELEEARYAELYETGK